MPWIPIYADDVDAEFLLDCLNDDSEIAFVLRDLPGRLVAKSRIEQLPRGRTPIWHVNSGPIPYFHVRNTLLRSETVEGQIADPWAGWEESVTSASGDPWFGPGHPGIVELDFRPESVEQAGGIGVTTFQWIGNYFSRTGSPASAESKKWWERLRRRIKKSACLIPALGPLDGSDKDRYAFPSALAKIRAGAWRDVNFHFQP